MEALALSADYIIWHYSTAFADIFRIWKNYLRFFLHFFSIPLLLKTFFAPWKRMGESYQKGFHPQEYLESAAVNMLMRLVGMGARVGAILAGIVTLSATLVAGAAFFLLWILAPIALAAFFLISARIFISLL